MSDHFAVQPADLVAHAGQVDLIADRVATAQQAGQAVRAGAGAYGQLCVMVPVMLGALQDVLVEGIADSVNGLRDTSGRLRKVAGNYEATDQAHAAALSRIQGRL